MAKITKKLELEAIKFTTQRTIMALVMRYGRNYLYWTEIFLRSNTNNLLADPKTKLWHESELYIADMFAEETGLPY